MGAEVADPTIAAGASIVIGAATLLVAGIPAFFAAWLWRRRKR